MKTLLTMASLILCVSANTLWASDTSTTEPQSTTCANCHGAKGNNQDLQGPNLAGQNHQYLTKQINAFSNGARIHPLLGSNDFKLGTDEINDLANYYASLKPDNSQNQTNQDGELIYSSCADCHGATGEGIAPFPRLSGQKPTYLKQQLVKFKTGVRQSAVMQAISVNLSDEEIMRLAAYLGSQQTLVDIASPSQNPLRENKSVEENSGTIPFGSTDENALVDYETASKVFIIVGSTTSKDDAIEHAIALKSKGYSSEVILSSSGYYGIALGRFNFANTNNVIKKAMTNKVATGNAYVMSTQRVEEYIYHAADK